MPRVFPSSLFRRKREFIFILALPVIVVLVFFTYRAWQYRNDLLTELPGYPYDINQAGDVLICTTNDKREEHFFLWNETRGARSLDFFNDKSLSVTGMNDAGQYLGVYTLLGEAVREHNVFIWSEAGGSQDVAPPTSSARAINNAGQVAGTLEDYDTAFFWSKETGMIKLGTLGGKQSIALGMNEAGQIVGRSQIKSGEDHAFFWSKETGMLDLGTLGGMESAAYRVNGAGQVVGSSETKSGKSHAFFWSKETGMLDLGTLGGMESAAYRVNGAGQIVGSAETKSGKSHAFFWSKETGMIDIGTLGGDHSFANAINNAGQVVGYASAKNNKSQAFIWTQAAGIQPLYDREASFSSANLINDAGQIAGRITYNTPWWFDAWEWVSNRVKFPEQYRPARDKFTRSLGVYWEVPLPQKKEKENAPQGSASFS